MKLVVGLGNPGSNYDNTRHNVGFEVVDRLLAKEPGAKYALKFQGAVCLLQLGGEKTLLVKPLTFMNLSGGCVALAAGFYQVEPTEILVVCDEVNLPLGKLRVRPSGSHGGQNGLRDIQNRLGMDYPRLRLGVGGGEKPDLTGHVLGRFKPDEKTGAGEMIATAADAVLCWLTDGIDACMNRYNGPGNE
ncbi:MAG: aminoacyl-tRNA hydrolase [Gemmataceae bacterium]|nr:aminoacyl-tRNA hydrolase [Gemmataceae bacterium]